MENLGVSFSRKSRSPQQIVRYKTFTQNRFANESSQSKTNSSNQKTTVGKRECLETRYSSKANEKKKNPSDFILPKRPSTAISDLKKSEFCEKDRNSHLQSSFFSEPKYSGRRRALTHSKERPQSFNKTKVKTPLKNQRNNKAEDLESLSLLSKAVFEQGQIIETFCVARDELLRKMTEKISSDRKPQEDATELEVGYYTPSGREKGMPSCPDFENSYSGTLEEIFQAWVHLLYFIINLRINFIRMLNCIDSESCVPQGEVEKDIIGQAIECVKFFSLLKIKSIVDFLDEFRLPNGLCMTQTQIRNYEQKLSSPFLCEMNSIQKKAKEILCQAKTFTTH